MKKAASFCQKIDIFFKHSSETPSHNHQPEQGKQGRKHDDVTLAGEASCSSDNIRIDNEAEPSESELNPRSSKVAVKSDPNYPDISTLGSEDLRDENIKVSLLTIKWENLNDFSFPSR